MTDPSVKLEALATAPRALARHLSVGRIARVWRKAVKLFRRPIRFFDDARDERLRNIGFGLLFLLLRWPLTPRSGFAHLVRLRWRIVGGRGARLAPLRGVVSLDDGTFEALDDDAQLDVFHAHLPLPRGPVRVHLTLELPPREEVAKLYVDLGQGFHESLAVAIPLDAEGQGSGLCILPLEGMLRLRFDPCAAPGLVRLRRLELKPVGFGATLRELRLAGWSVADARRYLLTGQPARPQAARRRVHLGGEVATVRRPTEADWLALAALPRVSTPSRAQVDVVVPVYGDGDATLACLFSVASNPQITAFELTVIDDCGPDPALREELVRLARLDFFTLLPNERNLGFVRSANRGMRLNAARDVVLLNADTEVYNDWLDRLRGVVDQDPRIATVTPLTNDGEIASYPFFAQRYPYTFELPFAELDRIAAESNAYGSVAAPTGVGFCFYIRRAAIDAIGFFDAHAFGAGYGEENDFCVRARLRGWQNLIATGIFVRHVGGLSFGASKARRVQAAVAILAQRYPFYRENIDIFLSRDPLAPHRRRLDIARLRLIPRRRTVLAIVHSRGGGTEAFVQDRAQRALADGVLTLIARPARNRLSPALRLEVHCMPDLPNLPELRLIGDWSELAGFLREQRVDAIEVHNLVGFDDLAVEEIPRIAASLAIGYEIFLHDYQALCPRINLVKPDLSFCDVGTPPECSACLRGGAAPFFARDISLWRQRQAQLLRGASVVRAPSQDTADRFARFLPDLPIEVSPHPDLAVWDEERPPGPLPVPPRRPDVLRVCLLGGLSEIKGLRILAAVAALAQRRRSAVEFVVVGETSNPTLLRRFANVYVTDRYEEAAALSTLRAVEPDLVWFPAIWPETFSYTLSIAQRLRLPVLVPDMGALTRQRDGVQRQVYPSSASAKALLDIMEQWRKADV